MRNDKLIFRSLVECKSNVDFQEKLTKHALQEVYDSTVNFYITNNTVKKQNLNIIQNYIILFASLSFIIYVALHYASMIHPALSILFTLGILSFNIRNILKSQAIKNAYSDMLSAIIINILGYRTAQTHNLSDKDLIQLLSDIKISKAALTKARKCGYLLSKTDIFLMYAIKADIKRDLAQSDDCPTIK